MFIPYFMGMAPGVDVERLTTQRLLATNDSSWHEAAGINVDGHVPTAMPNIVERPVVDVPHVSLVRVACQREFAASNVDAQFSGAPIGDRHDLGNRDRHVIF